MRQLFPMISLGLCLGGCGELDHNEYLVRRSNAMCRNYQTCATGYFDSQFRDFDDCTDEVSDDLENQEDNLPKSCDYDGEEGRRCASRLGGMGCEEFAEGAWNGACDLVWVCNG